MAAAAMNKMPAPCKTKRRSFVIALSLIPLLRPRIHSAAAIDNCQRARAGARHTPACKVVPRGHTHTFDRMTPPAQVIFGATVVVVFLSGTVGLRTHR
jgi:hypothetical protein